MHVYVSVYICSRWFTDIECISRVQTSPTDGRPVTHISSGTMRRDDFGKMCDGRSDGQSLLWLLSRNHKLLIYAASSRVRAQPARYRSNAIKPCVRSTCRENRISGHRRMHRTFLLCTTMQIGEYRRRCQGNHRETRIASQVLSDHILRLPRGIPPKDTSENHFNK